MRNAAIAAIVVNLQAITIANGYALNIGKVSRYVNTDLLSSRQFPAAMPVDNDDEERNPKANGWADVYFTINIVGFVSSKDDSSEEMNILDKAFKKAINADRTLGGTVANVTILPRAITELEGDEIESSFTRPVQVFYEANEVNGE